MFDAWINSLSILPEHESNSIPTNNNIKAVNNPTTPLLLYKNKEIGGVFSTPTQDCAMNKTIGCISPCIRKTIKTYHPCVLKYTIKNTNDFGEGKVYQLCQEYTKQVLQCLRTVVLQPADSEFEINICGAVEWDSMKHFYVYLNLPVDVIRLTIIVDYLHEACRCNLKMPKGFRLNYSLSNFNTQHYFPRPLSRDLQIVYCSKYCSTGAIQEAPINSNWEFGLQTMHRFTGWFERLDILPIKTTDRHIYLNMRLPSYQRVFLIAAQLRQTQFDHKKLVLVYNKWAERKTMPKVAEEWSVVQSLRPTELMSAINRCTVQHDMSEDDIFEYLQRLFRKVLKKKVSKKTESTKYYRLVRKVYKKKIRKRKRNLHNNVLVFMLHNCSKKRTLSASGELYYVSVYLRRPPTQWRPKRNTSICCPVFEVHASGTQFLQHTTQTEKELSRIQFFVLPNKKCASKQVVVPKDIVFVINCLSILLEGKETDAVCYNEMVYNILSK